MKTRLNSKDISNLENLLLSQKIRADGVIDRIQAYSKNSPDFRDVLRWFRKSLLEERLGLVINYNFEANPSSFDKEIGLFYIDVTHSYYAFNPIDLIIGFDSYSREWYFGCLEMWRREAQRIAFEDNWNRWIAVDFIQEIERIFSAGIEEDMTEIRRLFDYASQKAQYIPKVEPCKDCDCPIERIVQELEYADLQAIATD